MPITRKIVKTKNKAAKPSSRCVRGNSTAKKPTGSQNIRKKSG